ncbi:far1-related sequence 10 -like protein [Gossypium arboreum]|uniref:Protein FAR1-RELATED SEQUENCE n=1 Tax=Gossypium arboreum TaxID=29729 RepID=A0A0B0Q0U7_GOSAR|nr:far1-related sequence 10 -like protein [Gossypium arboreum]
MTMKPSNNIWIRRQQCPCGDWKCYVKYEGDDQTSVSSQLIKNETTSTSSSSEAVFMPYVGQIFKTDEDAFEYYSNFARKNGFSIRKARSTESQNLGIYRRDFVCYRSGFNQPRKKANVEHPRDRKSVRCGCDAKLYLTKEIVNGVTQWYISQFSNVHNHELLEDDQVRLLPAYRKIQEADQERILLLSKAGFPVNRIVKVLELEKGVQPGQLPFIEKDTFLRFMRGRCPQTVLTDIDSSLRDAIARELPDTKHVICSWHVHSKLSSWFMPLLGSQYEEFKAEFDMLCHLEGIEEFEHQWNHLVARFGLASDKHIALLFSYRTSWPLCYIRSYFLARSMTAEFYQSLDEFFKRILSGQTCLQLFFEQVWFAADLRNRSKEALQYMHTKTGLPIEENARSILTPYAFNALQHEIVQSMQYATTELANGSYLVRHYKKMEGEYLVIWISQDEQIHCSCKEFEHSGILCRHCLRVLTVKNYFEIPEKYILFRWRLESSLVALEDQNGQCNSDEYAQVFHSLAATLLTESLFTKERFNHVHRELTRLLEHVRNMPVSNEFASNMAANNISES